MSDTLKLNKTLKRFNLSSFIKRRCQELNINATIEVEPYNVNWFVGLFEPARETITVTFKLPYDNPQGKEQLTESMTACNNITTLCDDINNYLDGIKSQL